MISEKMGFSEIHFIYCKSVWKLFYFWKEIRFLSSSDAIYVLLLCFALFKYFELYDILHTAQSLFSFM